ncbi:MAG TPA: glycosyltransferase family 4 protein [Terracidiphilus sp.]|jgi:glycosyltransferase involved in cell wall biosynthesis|nr:glycosyltransferase family 4 protein [Terracidiphilus sp.]
MKTRQSNAVRVLHVLGTADPGATAICRIVQSLAAAADPAQYQIHACFLQNGSLLDHFQQAGIPATCIHWNGTPRHVSGAMRYAALLRSADFSILHQHVAGGFLTLMGRSLTHARVLLHLHGRASERDSVVPPVFKLPRRDAVIANSQVVAQYCNDPSAVVIYPGIDVSNDPPHRRAHQGLIIGTACRLEPIKGITHLLKAFAVLASERADVRLEIAGAGSLRASLEEESRRLAVADRVRFLGWRDDLPAVMAGWDIFVLPSLDEGFGVSALEAMAAGLPVVASAVGGLCELVANGESGFLVSPASPGQIALRLRELIENALQREAMGTAGRERAQREFSLARMIDQTFDVYSRLLRDHQTTAGN